MVYNILSNLKEENKIGIQMYIDQWADKAFDSIEDVMLFYFDRPVSSEGSSRFIIDNSHKVECLITFITSKRIGLARRSKRKKIGCSLIITTGILFFKMYSKGIKI